MNKTALQDFLKFMGIKETDPHVKPFLEKEKNQILNAYDDGHYAGSNGTCKEYNTNGEQYFNQTYS